MVVRETWPEMEIHLSVLANTVNAAAAHFWKNVGISWVILSCELSLDQVYVLEERQRAGSYMSIEEDEHGTYVMNSKDLRGYSESGRSLYVGDVLSLDAARGLATPA